jgi:alkylation response protein AidB-like acyl-CoA dehydrogenase
MQDQALSEVTTRGAAVSENGLRYLEAARSLIPLIEAEADEMERDRKISPKVIEALKDAGLIWMLVPEAAGGGGLRVVEAMKVVEQIASADGSTGWCLHAFAFGAGIQAGMLPEAGTKRLFGGVQRQITCGAAAPIGRGTIVDGGIRVTGRWPFGSGSDYADFIGCGVTMYDDEGNIRMVGEGVPDMRFAFAPRDQIQFHGNWNVSGLVGTGSVDYSASDLFVADELIVPLTGAAPVRSEPMYQIGLAGLAATAHNSVILGMMRGALREVAKLTAEKSRQGYPVPVGDYPVFQYEFAKYEAEYQSARAYALGTLDAAEQYAEREGRLSPELTARVQQSANWSHKVAERVVNFARLWSGTQAFREPSRLGRVFRDVSVATQHIQVDDINLVNSAPDLLAAWRAL